MSIVYVEFSDQDETEVVSWFASPQDSALRENYASVDSSDARYRAFFESMPNHVQAGMVHPS